VKVGVVSDVHNNVDALCYALERLRDCDTLICLGDLISDYRVTPEIIRLARDAGMLGIVGNHEKTILLHTGSRMRAQLAPDDLAYLESLPDQRELTFDGRKVKVVHGAPWDDPSEDHCQYVMEHDRDALARLKSPDIDLLLLGHTHISMSRRLGHTLVVNPGSCGEARDSLRRLSFAEIDFRVGIVTVQEIRHGMSPERIVQAEL
jgi:putative phosphoesterase